MKLSIILLAAGLSERMGEDKLLMEYNNDTLLQRAVNLLCELDVYEKLRVTTAQRQSKVTLPHGIKTIINPDPGRGISSSIKIAVENSSGTHYMFMAADQPELTAEDIKPIIDVARNNTGKIIYPVANCEPLMPSIFPQTLRTELLELTGDTGGRALREKNPQLCFEVQVKNKKNFNDIDTLEEFYAIN